MNMASCILEHCRDSLSGLKTNTAHVSTGQEAIPVLLGLKKAAKPVPRVETVGVQGADALGLVDGHRRCRIQYDKFGNVLEPKLTVAPAPPSVHAPMAPQCHTVPLPGCCRHHPNTPANKHPALSDLFVFIYIACCCRHSANTPAEQHPAFWGAYSTSPFLISKEWKTCLQPITLAALEGRPYPLTLDATLLQVSKMTCKIPLIRCMGCYD